MEVEDLADRQEKMHIGRNSVVVDSQKERPMEPPKSPLFVALLLLIGMLILVEVNSRLSVRRHPKKSGGLIRRAPKLPTTK
jgi:hypothetical protein